MQQDNVKISKITYVSSPTHLNFQNEKIKVVNDIYEAVEHLKRKEKIARYEFGNSMMPMLMSGEYCVIEPIKDIYEVNIGDTVLCDVGGHLMTHMVLMSSTTACDSPFFLIGTSSYGIYGWTNKIYGICNGTNVLEISKDVEEVEEI